MSHYLVTGAAGFIGARTSQMLIEQSHTVVGIDNMNDAYDPRMKDYRLKKLQAMEGFTFHKHDISEKSAIDLFKNEKLDGVINLAARAGVRYSVENPWVFLESNVTGKLNMLEVCHQFGTHENNAPYFMYANREGWTELYAQNHPAYGFYQDNGVGGNVYDAGLPKGLYKLGIRYWDMKGWGSIYPSTRKPQGNVLAYQEYWFRIQSKDGVGIGAARTGDLSASRDLTPLSFASVMPNPVASLLA